MGDVVPMQKLSKIYTDRLDKFLSSVHFSDVNLHAHRMRLVSDGAARIRVFHVPSDLENGKPLVGRVLQMDSHFEECAVGLSIGPAWTTHWFKLSITVPETMAGQRVWLHWKLGCESLLYDMTGNPLCGFSDERCDYLLSEEAISGKTYNFLIEASCNGLSGNGNGGLINAPDNGRHYQLQEVTLCVFNEDAAALIGDLKIIKDIIKALGAESPRGAEALHLCNAIVNSIQRPNDRPEDIEDAIRQALACTRKFLAVKNSQSAHTVYALGHCHIDTAWLWDYSETRRKCARSWSSQVELMTREGFSDFRFVCSQMQQYDWVRTDYPRLFERIKEVVATGQFVPIGGSWVEMDANMPSGESFVRQFLYGQLFSREHFGFTSKIFWLPDTFGYSAQLPQIMRHCGLRYFFSQKLSWNNINKFPHNSFWWQGLDGTKVLTHFPPSNTYTAGATVDEVCASAKNNQDKDRTKASLLVYGIGDGGGGPNRDMLKNLQRMADCDGLQARIKFDDPENFFGNLERDSGPKLLSWSGELYLEFHRGTFTTQAKTKKGNRQSEELLRHAEICSVVQSWLTGKTSLYPKAKIEAAWKSVLLNQFHDVLPGSSIEKVYRDAEALYAQVERDMTRLIHDSMRSINASIVEFEKVGSSAQLPSSRASHPSASFPAKGAPASKPISHNSSTAILVGNTAIPKSGGEPEMQANGSTLYFNDLPFSRSLLVRNGRATGSRDQYHVVKDIPPFSLAVLDRSRVATKKAETSDDEDFEEKDDKEGDEYVQVAGKEKPVENWDKASVQDEPKRLTVRNKWIAATFDKRTGELVSVRRRLGSKEYTEEMLASPHRLVLYDDVPNFWDAWDVEVYYEEKGTVLQGNPWAIVEECDQLVRLERTVRISDRSTMRQTVSLTSTSPTLEFACDVEWHENRKLLRAEFDVHVQAEEATYETQFGLVRRPTHRNTTWDVARFECCGQRFVDVSEPGRGVSLITDCKYGYSARKAPFSTTNSTSGGNSTSTMIGASLLKASKAPDLTADMGSHTFKYGLLCHDNAKGHLLPVIREAHIFSTAVVVNNGFDVNLNQPHHHPTQANDRHRVEDDARLLDPTWLFKSLIDVRNAAGANGECPLLVAAVKATEDQSGATIVRLYESVGMRGRATITLHGQLHVQRAFLCNGLEEAQEELSVVDNGVAINYRPFEVLTVKLVVLPTNKRS